MGLYELLRETGAAGGRWTRDPKALRSSDVKTLLVAEPLRAGLTTGDANVLYSWVAGGNTLIILVAGRDMPPVPWQTIRFEDSLQTELAIRLRRPPSSSAGALVPMEPPDKTVRRAFVLAPTHGAESLAMEETAGYLVHEGTSAFLPLYADNGRPCIAVARLGRGTVYILASAAPFTNAGLLKSDNLAFALNLAAIARETGGIWFDEYHHGYRTTFGALDLLKTPGAVACVILAAAAALLFLLSKGRRFGPARPSIKFSRRHALEFVYSVADLYRRAQNRFFAADVLLRTLTRRLSRIGSLVRLPVGGESRGVYRGAFAQPLGEIASKVSPEIRKDSELLDIVKMMDELERSATRRKTA